MGVGYTVCMLGKHSANELHPEPEITFATVLWDIVRVWELLRITALRHFLSQDSDWHHCFSVGLACLVDVN